PCAPCAAAAGRQPGPARDRRAPARKLGVRACRRMPRHHDDEGGTTTMTMSVTERDRLDGVVRLLDPARNAVRTSEPGSKAARALFEEVVSTSSARTELPAPLFALPAPGWR